MKIQNPVSLMLPCILIALITTACTTNTPNPLDTPTLANLWIGTIFGDVTTTDASSVTPPTNPNGNMSTDVRHEAVFERLVFDDNGRPVYLPLQVSGFELSLNLEAITAFAVGDTQTITESSSDSFPVGATGLGSSTQSITTTLTVTESTLELDHFRVVYTVNSTRTSNTTADVTGGFCADSTSTSTGPLTFEATAIDGLMNFSVDFDILGTSTQTQGQSPCPSATTTTATDNSRVKGTLTGTLARD